MIKIPEEMYKWVNDANKTFNDYGISDFVDLIKNGTPLPKGHGRIADIDEAIKCIEDVKGEDAIWAINLIEWACSKRTIIETDKDSESKELYTKVKDTSENHYYKENNDNFYPGYLCNEDGSVCR